MAKHFLALHAKLADRAGGGNAAIDIEEIVMAAVGVEPRGENALILGFLGLQYERPGAVPEQDAGGAVLPVEDARSDEHTSELQSLMRNPYAVFCLKKNNN